MLLKFVEQLKIVTKKRGVVKLGEVMNYAQRELVLECERQLAETGRIRIIVLKARQIGISTVIESVIFALTILLDNFNSLIISHDIGSAEHIKSMTDTYWKTYPFKQYHVEKYSGRKHLVFGDTNSGIQITTAKTISAARSRTLHAIHASEFAFWDDASSFMTSMNPSIPTTGISAIFIESTANGIGNSFHTTWSNAVKNDSEFSPLFFPWHKHPEYTAEFLPASVAAKYIPDVLDEEEKRLFDQGINIARLTWRRYAIANLVNQDPKKTMQNPVDAFHQEFPSSSVEAFLTSGRNVFPLNYLLAHYEPETGTRGRLMRVMEKVEFIEDPNGPLIIYKWPAKDKSWGIYQIGGDPTHTTTGDFACCQVINRRTLEQAAVYRHKCDPISFGQDMFLLGIFYNMATLVPEKEGPGYATVGYLMGQNYPFVWESQKVDRTPGKVTADTFGWGTNQQSKHLAIGYLLKSISEPMEQVGNQSYGLLLHDEVTIMEMRDYVTNERGSGYCNSDGSEYDDGVMALGIALATHFIDAPPAAYDPLMPKDKPVTAMSRVDEILAETGTSVKDIMATMAKSPPWEDWDKQ